MGNDVKQAKDFLDYGLQDDNTETGGIGFIGETLRDFLWDVGYDENTDMDKVNNALKECGIKPIVW